MHIIFADQTLEIAAPSIFLGGPTPRISEVRSWRPEALSIMKEMEFSGTALVPERRNWEVKFNYLDQVEWEFAALETCSVLAFWVPRCVPELAGFTTNVEFGRYVGSGKCIYGRPEGTPHTRYLDWLYTKLTGLCAESTLVETLRAAIQATIK